MRLLILLCLLILLFPSSIVHPIDKTNDKNKVLVLRVEGTIDPAVTNYVLRGLKTAYENNYACIVIELNTPGGLMESMKKIAEKMIASKIPVVVYVYPKGATATSAGFFILMASDIAAMAPATSTGSAHPVSVEGKMDRTMREKVTHYGAAYMRSLVKEHKRNVKWAEKAVRKSVSITQDEALEQKVIEVVSESTQKLLQDIDGYKIKKGKTIYHLKTTNARLIYIDMSYREKFLHTISHPNIAYVLFMVGVYGLIFEVTHAGTMVPGIIGAIALLLAFTAFQVIPINTAGLIIIIIGILLLVFEVKFPTHGILAIGGILLMALGSFMLVDSSDPSFQISRELIFTTVLTTAAFFIIALTAVVRAHKKPVTTGAEGLIGNIGIVKKLISPEGLIMVRGELWKAISISGDNIEEGDKVMVKKVDGMNLKVQKHLE